MQNRVCGIILKVSHPSMGDTSKIEILGKTMLEWVRLALAEDFVCAIDFDESVSISKQVKPYAKGSEYAVILYSDTPLITRKTILDAIFELKASKESVINLTRGMVVKTPYLGTENALQGINHRFFDEEDFMTALSFKQTALVCDVLRGRIISYHMKNGVQFDDPASSMIGCDVIIEKGVRVGPGNNINGRCLIKQNTRLLCSNTIDTSIIDEDCSIENSVIRDSYVGKGVTVGPFAHIRGDSQIGDGCRIGNFVEIKNSVLHKGVKAAHLSYIGDAQVGERTNIGCGTVFCNYDGVSKHQTVVGKNVFIGSNSNLIAPVTIGDNAVIAAGSTITDNVPSGALGIARERQVTKPDYKRKAKKD